MIASPPSQVLPPVWRRRHLSLAEQRVVALICSGLPTKIAAARLDRSPLTVRNQLNNAMRKLGVTNRYELIAKSRTGEVPGPGKIQEAGDPSDIDGFVYAI